MKQYEFNINDNFIVKLDKTVEVLSGSIIAPTTIKLGKPSDYVIQNKTREYKVFHSITYIDFEFVKGTFAINDFIGYLKAFVGNKLNSKKLYSEKMYTLQIVNHKDDDTMYEISLQIDLNNTDVIYLTRVQAMQLTENLQKIISRCEIDYENEQYHPIEIIEI